MKIFLSVLFLVFSTSTFADYCQHIRGGTEGYLCRNEATVKLPVVTLVYNGDVDGKSANDAQFVSYGPLPVKAFIEVYVDFELAYSGTRTVGQRFKLNGVSSDSSVEINVWDTEGNYVQFVRLDFGQNRQVGYESGAFGIWAR
jgi:hypothetical protein